MLSMEKLYKQELALSVLGPLKPQQNADKLLILSLGRGCLLRGCKQAFNMCKLQLLRISMGSLLSRISYTRFLSAAEHGKLFAEQFNAGLFLLQLSLKVALLIKQLLANVMCSLKMVSEVASFHARIISPLAFCSHQLLQ